MPRTPALLLVDWRDNTLPLQFKEYVETVTRIPGLLEIAEEILAINPFIPAANVDAHPENTSLSARFERAAFGYAEMIRLEWPVEGALIFHLILVADSWHAWMRERTSHFRIPTTAEHREASIMIPTESMDDTSEAESESAVGKDISAATYESAHVIPGAKESVNRKKLKNWSQELKVLVAKFKDAGETIQGQSIIQQLDVCLRILGRIGKLSHLITLEDINESGLVPVLEQFGNVPALDVEGGNIRDLASRLRERFQTIE